MRGMPTRVIEALFGKGAKARVVEHLYLLPDRAPPTPARALAREAGVPYGSIDKTLRELVANELVVREETPHGPQYRAPHEDKRLAGLFMVLRHDSQIVEQLVRALKPVKHLAYAGIFGSFASGRAGRDSDIDLVLIEAPDFDRFAALGAIEKVARRVQRDVSPQFYSDEEFSRQIHEADPIVMGILANPRIDLKGSLRWAS